MYIHNFEDLLGQVLQLPIRDGNQQLILKLIVLCRSSWSIHPSPSRLNLSVLEIINNIQYLKEWGQVAYVDPSFCKMVGQVPQLWIRNGTDTDTKNWQCSEELSKVLHPSLSCLESSTFAIPKHEVNLSVCSLASPTHHQCYVRLIFLWTLINQPMLYWFYRDNRREPRWRGTEICHGCHATWVFSCGSQSARLRRLPFDYTQALHLPMW